MLIEADLHCHSIASSHAYSTVNEMAASAKEIGLKAFALTDHAPAMPDAPHIWHFHNLGVLPRRINDVILIRGTEVNVVSPDGALDMSQRDLKDLEWVIASYHMPVIKPGSVEENTRSYIKLIENNIWVDAIGHCTTDNFPIDFTSVVKCCKEYNKFIELNESSIQYKKGSRKNSYELLKICKKYDAQIVVNTDSHYSGIIGITDNSENIIREIDFPDRLIFNSNYNNVINFIAKKRNINLITEK